MLKKLLLSSLLILSLISVPSVFAVESDYDYNGFCENSRFLTPWETTLHDVLCVAYPLDEIYEDIVGVQDSISTLYADYSITRNTVNDNSAKINDAVNDATNAQITANQAQSAANRADSKANSNQNDIVSTDSNVTQLQTDVTTAQNTANNADGIASQNSILLDSITQDLEETREELEDVKFNTGRLFFAGNLQNDNPSFSLAAMTNTIYADGTYNLKITQSGMQTSYNNSTSSFEGTDITDFRITISSVHQLAGTSDKITTFLHTFEPGDEVYYEFQADVNFEDRFWIQFDSELVELLPDDVNERATYFDGFYWLEK